MIVATSNEGKVKEIKKIFKEYEIYSLKDKNIDVDVIEDADTFYGNALKKAMEIYNVSNEPVLADDSGLCINLLNDFPGVMTHRFLGNNSSDDDRNDALIDMVNNLSDRSAKVVCVIVYYDGVNVLTGEGILDGKISMIKRGNNGFGFDKIFELEDGRTLAELSSEEKNKISARYLALKDIENKIKELSLNLSKNIIR